MTDADLAAEIEAERAALRGNDAEGAGAGASGLVLRVQCQKGSVQIRAAPDEPLAPLLAKFAAYAAEHGWGLGAGGGARKTTMWRLQYDGDDVNVKTATPKALGLEADDVLDAVPER